MTLPFGFGLEEVRLTITSQGVEHAITLRVNRLHGRIDLERAAHEVEVGPGAVFALVWPDEIDLAEVRTLTYRHAWLNPHAHL
jgi:hypothetical protein